MTITLEIVAPDTRLAEHVASRLAKAGYPSTTRTAPTTAYALRHHPRVPDETLDALAGALLPFQPAIEPAADLGGDVELHLGIPMDLPYVALETDSEAFGGRVKEALEAVGFPVGMDVQAFGVECLFHAAVAPGARHLARSVLIELGVVVPEAPLQKPWAREPLSPLFPQITLGLWERLPVAALAAAVPLRIATDDPDGGQALARELARVGFAEITIADLPVAPGARFSFSPGRLRNTPALIEAMETLLQEFLDAAGVDLRRTPLHRGGGQTCAPVCIDLPLAAHRAGQLRPSAGAYPERWQIRLLMDDPRAEALSAMLRDRGFADPARAPLPPGSLGPILRLGAAADHLAVEAELRAVIAHVLPEVESLAVWRAFGEDDSLIEIELPTDVAPETLAERRARACAAVRIGIQAPERGVREALAAGLTPLGPGSIEAGSLHRDLRLPEIDHEDVPDLVLAHVTERATAATGIRFYLSQASPGPGSVVVVVPAGSRRDAVLEAPSLLPPPLIEASERRLRVGGITVERPADAPSPAAPALDPPLGEALAHVVHAFALDIPCLLVGPAGAGRRWVLGQAAALLGQPVAIADVASLDPDALRARIRQAAGWLVLHGVDEARSASREIITAALESPRPGVRLCGTARPGFAGPERERWLGDRLLGAPDATDLSAFLAARVHGRPVSITVHGRRYHHAAPPVAALAPLAVDARTDALLRALAGLGARLGVGRGRLCGWLDRFAVAPPATAWEAIASEVAPPERPLVEAAASALMRA